MYTFKVHRLQKLQHCDSRESFEICQENFAEHAFLVRLGLPKAQVTKL